MPIAWVFPYPLRNTIIQLLNFPKGVVAMLFARFMFYLFVVPTHWAILVISVVWISVYYRLFRQPLVGWTSFVCGLVFGWAVHF